jgi:oxygen-dependent protoporphyrinogen oxidase
MAEALDVVIVGGGLSGISAALDLQRRGRKVLVIEAGPRLGGKVGSTHTHVGEFPEGPVSFNGGAPAFWNLFELLGLAEDDIVKLHPASAARYVVRDGRMCGLKPNPWSLMTTRALTWCDKVALIREYLVTKRPEAGAADESLFTVLVRRFGVSLVEHFFSAVLSGVFAGDLKRLSAQSCLPAVVNAEKQHGSVLKGLLKASAVKAPGTRKGFFTLKGGLGVVGERAAQRLPCMVGTQVRTVAVESHRISVQVGHTTVTARAMVLATPAHDAARLLMDSVPAAAKILHAFEYAPLTLVQWAERRPRESRLPFGFGYLCSPKENMFSLGALFLGDLLSQTPRRFSSFVGGALQPARAALSDEELVKGVTGELLKLTGGTFGELVNVVRWPRAVFQPPVGHASQLTVLHAALENLPIVLAGSHLGGAAMKDAISSGFAAAAQVDAFWSSRT